MDAMGKGCSAHDIAFTMPHEAPAGMKGRLTAGPGLSGFPSRGSCGPPAASWLPPVPEQSGHAVVELSNMLDAIRCPSALNRRPVAEICPRVAGHLQLSISNEYGMTQSHLLLQSGNLLPLSTSNKGGKEVLLLCPAISGRSPVSLLCCYLALQLLYLHKPYVCAESRDLLSHSSPVIASKDHDQGCL